VVSPWDEALDRPMLLPADAAVVTLRAAGGTLELYGVRLDDPRTPLPPGPVDPAPPPAADAFDLAAPAPCAAPACDDTPALAAALAAAPPGPVRLSLRRRDVHAAHAVGHSPAGHTPRRATGDGAALGPGRRR
jgi:hypothetical protein